MPAWLGVLALVGFSFNHPANWQDFVVHGEFLIYSAALVAASTRLISREVETGRPFPHRPWFNLCSHAIIIPSAAVYAIAKALSFMEKPTGPKTGLILCFSAVMVVSGVAFSFFVFVLDQHRSTTPVPFVNVAAEMKKEAEELSGNFDKLGKGDNAGG